MEYIRSILKELFFANLFRFSLIFFIILLALVLGLLQMFKKK